MYLRVDINGCQALALLHLRVIVDLVWAVDTLNSCPLPLFVSVTTDVRCNWVSC